MLNIGIYSLNEIGNEIVSEFKDFAEEGCSYMVYVTSWIRDGWGEVYFVPDYSAALDQVNQLRRKAS